MRLAVSRNLQGPPQPFLTIPPRSCIARAHREERPRFDEQFWPLVGGAALVGHLGRAPLPGLQVQRGPDHVEEGEQDEAEVLEELGLTAEEELQGKKTTFWQGQDRKDALNCTQYTLKVSDP